MAIIEKVSLEQPMRNGEIAGINKLNELIDSINAGGGTINTIEPNEDTTPARASSDNAIAVGGNSQANGKNSVAVGWGTLAAAQNTTVVGNIAGSTGYNGTALGKGANADAVNSVALGQGSLASEVNTVSVGTASLQRRIVNVATPVEGTDVATKAYVDSVAGDLSNMHYTTFDLSVGNGSTATYTVPRIDPLEGTPLVFLGVTATDGTNWYGNVTANYRVVDGTTLSVSVSNPNSVTVNTSVCVMVIETGA